MSARAAASAVSCRAAMVAIVASPISLWHPSEHMMNRPEASAMKMSGSMPIGAPTHCVMTLRAITRSASSGVISPESIAS